jgi:3-phosphoshikimate 1-carboxyvinyltransferase
LNLIVHPGTPLRGQVRLPGDKSISHRAALFAALAQGESLLENFSDCGVSRAMLSALTALRVPWELNGSELRVYGGGLLGLVAPQQVIDCGNSATTLRLLAGALAAAGVPAVLDGSVGLRRRPMGRIVKPLREMGVQIEAVKGRADIENPVDKGRPADKETLTAPLSLAARTPGNKLHPIDICLEVASAQVKTCLLLAALAADGVSTIQEPSVSRDHTERMLQQMGVDLKSELLVDQKTHAVTLTPSPLLSLRPLSFSIHGDISSAAFIIVAALVTPDSEVTLEGVLLNPTRTGLLDALRSMGADLSVVYRREANGEPFGDVVARYSSLRGVQISGPQVVRMIDEFPAFSIAAAHAQGVSIISDAGELRHKESDRISALCSELRVLGVEVEESPDGFSLVGGRQLGGGEVDPHGDHRLAMALSIAGLAAAGLVKVSHAEIISESFPEFIPTLQTLGAELSLEKLHDEG